MRAAMNEENVDIPPNHDLSEIDKAYAAINYPRDLSSVAKALKIIDLDPSTTLAIIEAYKAHDFLEMRRLLADPDCKPFFGIYHPVVAISRTMRRKLSSQSRCISDGGQGDDPEVPLLSRDA